MKVLNVYRSAPSETTKKLVEIVSEGRESDSFDLNVDNPDYDWRNDGSWMEAPVKPLKLETDPAGNPSGG